MPYIDVDLLKESVLGWNPPLDTEQLKHMIDTIPLADVVEVVRCKDCRMFVDNKEALVTYCTRECKSLTVNPDDFCSYGERKEGAE